MFEEHEDYGVEHFEVVEAAGVGHGVVGHKEPEENENEVLEAEGEPVDAAPGGAFG